PRPALHGDLVPILKAEDGSRKLAVEVLLAELLRRLGHRSGQGWWGLDMQRRYARAREGERAAWHCVVPALRPAERGRSGDRGPRTLEALPGARGEDVVNLRHHAFDLVVRRVEVRCHADACAGPIVNHDVA